MANDFSNTIVIRQIILRVGGSRCLNYGHVGYCSNRYICLPRCIMLQTGGQEWEVGGNNMSRKLNVLRSTMLFLLKAFLDFPSVDYH